MSDFPIMKCIVKGCDNHKGEGQFVNDICSPCHRMLTEGVVTPSYNWFATEITIAIERTKKAEVELAACSAAFDRQQEQLDRNAERIAGLRLDAERYRWLRARPVEDCTTPRIEVNAWTCNVNDDGVDDSVNEGDVLAGEALDAAIDAAMKEEGK